jgi:hypothetical protein
MEGLTVISVAILVLGIFLSVLGWFGVLICAIRRRRVQRWFATAFVGALGWIGGAGALIKQESLDKDIERVRLDESGEPVTPSIPFSSPQGPAAPDEDEAAVEGQIPPSNTIRPGQTPAS